MSLGPYYTTLKTPIGVMALTADDEGLTGLHTEQHTQFDAMQAGRADKGPFRKALAQLDAYFAGALMEFSLTLAPKGTVFQKKVWAALALIPYGETRSYGVIAASLGMPKSARAVGLGNRANPICIIVPCHRVIGATGKLTGFAEGMGAKEWLLQHEANAEMRRAG